MEYEWNMGDNDGIMVTNCEIYPQYIIILLIINWLVVQQPSWKIWKSMGRMIPYIMEKNNMFETTNQLRYPMDAFFTTFCGYDGI